MTEHAGQEFIHVLEGKIMVYLDNNQYVLEKGDNFYYNSNKPHSIKNIGSSSAKILWIITPPYI